MSLTHRPFQTHLAPQAYSDWAAGARARAEAALATNPEMVIEIIKEEITAENIRSAVDFGFEEEHRAIVALAACLLNRKRHARVAIRRSRKTSPAERFAQLVSLLSVAREKLDEIVNITASWDNILAAGQAVSRQAAKVCRIERSLLETGRPGLLVLGFDLGLATL